MNYRLCYVDNWEKILTRKRCLCTVILMSSQPTRSIFSQNSPASLVSFITYLPVTFIKKLKITKLHYINPKGNSYCCRKSSARGPWFKVSSEELSIEIDILMRSTIQVQNKTSLPFYPPYLTSSFLDRLCPTMYLSFSSY